jgi:hypothetical protein
VRRLIATLIAFLRGGLTASATPVQARPEAENIEVEI